MKTSRSNQLASAAPGRTRNQPQKLMLARGGALLAFATYAIFGACSAQAAAPRPDKDHKKHQPAAVVRIAQGQVINGARKPLEGAIVYLEDPTSLNIKSYLSDANGHFHFNQLATQTDYELWAEQNGTQSKHKFISQFSSRTKLNFQLTLDPNRKKKLLGFL